MTATTYGARALRKGRRVAVWGPNRVRRQVGLARLRRSDDRRAQRLALALTGVAGRHATAAEASWIDRIEQRRGELNQSSEALSNRLSEWTGREEHTGILVVDTVQEVSRKSRPSLWALLLFRLVREFRPNACIELGTGLGISAAYQAAALELNGHGHLVTIEAAKSRADLASVVLDELGLTRARVVNGRFDEVVVPLLAAEGSVDWVFVDGDHSGDATLRYFGNIFRYLSANALIVFDDISYSDDMEAAWHAIARDDRIGLAVDLGPVGLVLPRPRHDPPVLALPLEPKPNASDRDWLRTSNTMSVRVAASR